MERLCRKKHTVCATNLTPKELLERYGERVNSRLMDTSTTACLQLKGRDLRLIRRK